MSNKPEHIAFGKRLVRTVTVNGVRKFSATDVCNALGYNRPNKILGRYCDSAPEYIRLETRGGLQECRMIGAEDIRAILAHSKRKNAPRMRRWLDNLLVPGITVIMVELGGR